MIQYRVEFLDDVDPQALQRYWDERLSFEPTSHVVYEPNVVVFTADPKLGQEYLPNNHVKVTKHDPQERLFEINLILPMFHQFSKVAFEKSLEKQKDYRRQVILLTMNIIHLERQFKGDFLCELAEAEFGHELILTKEPCSSESMSSMESSDFIEFLLTLPQLERNLPSAVFFKLINSIVVLMYNTQQVPPTQKGAELQRYAEHYYGYRLEKK